MVLGSRSIELILQPKPSTVHEDNDKEMELNCGQDRDILSKRNSKKMNNNGLNDDSINFMKTLWLRKRFSINQWKIKKAK